MDVSVANAADDGSVLPLYTTLEAKVAPLPPLAVSSGQLFPPFNQPKQLPFLGTRRRLTWVRPPLDEKGMELTALRRSASDGDGDWFKSRREISSPSPKSRLHSWKHFTTRLFRKRANTFPVAPGLNTGKISNKRKERKLWNMIHIMSGGQNFKCPEWIFQGHPKTLLGNPERRQLYFHQKHRCYLFPHILPDAFNAILEYYQTGVVVRPERLTLNYFLEQIELFDLEQDAIDKMLRKEGVYRFDRRNNADQQKSTMRHLIWSVLDQPWSGVTAKMYGFLSLFMTVLSVLLYIIETLPELEKYSISGKTSVYHAFQSPIMIVTTICFVFFCLEFILRLSFCPSLKTFMRTWTNWTDFLSIIPFIIMTILLLLHDYRALSKGIFNILRTLRLLLITRVLGTSRFYRQHWIVILVQTLWNNIHTLFVLFFLLIICMVGFGGLIYALEDLGEHHGSTPVTPSIPLGMWWAVITMTTVGYGDVAAQRAAGQITSVICGCVGLIFTGFVLESITYEYHRLMKSNSQFLRYQAEIEIRRRHQSTIRPPLQRITSRCSQLSQLGTKSHAESEVQITINGAEFYLNLTDINRHPNSLLGHPSKRAPYFNPTTGSYFFPRNQDIFPAIFQYYQSPLGSVLRRPPFVSMKRFVEEIEFFQLSPRAVVDLFASEGIRLIDEKLPQNRRLRYWHLVLEHPNFNYLARFIRIVSVAVTITFITTIVLQSVPALWQPTCFTAMVPLAESSDTHQSNQTVAVVVTGRNVSNVAHNDTKSACTTEITFITLETVCTAWFALELCARFYVSPVKSTFLRQPMNWFDVLAIFPYIFTIIEVSSIPTNSFYLSRTFALFKAMRLLRLISILKFSRYFSRIQMIFTILRSTLSELLMLCYLMLINSIIFGTVIYAVEFADLDGNINSIPRGMYWSWITMLTIGYGDIVPETPVGKVIGTACAILGIVFWTLPMTLISDHFANYRRLFEGQRYMLQCLTRITRLLETETETKRVHACRQASTTDKGIPRTNGVGKETQSRPVIFGLPKDGDGDTSDDMGSRDPSPKPLLSRLNSHPKLFRGPSFSKVSLAPTPEMEILTSDDPVRPRTDSSLRFSRLEFEGLHRVKSKGSFSTGNPGDGVLEEEATTIGERNV